MLPLLSVSDVTTEATGGPSWAFLLLLGAYAGNELLSYLFGVLITAFDALTFVPPFLYGVVGIGGVASYLDLGGRSLIGPT